jgi:hypothetical protein
MINEEVNINKMKDDIKLLKYDPSYPKSYQKSRSDILKGIILQLGLTMA